ncbi:hypothetical protein D3C85_1230750 [compost metagenome]
MLRVPLSMSPTERIPDALMASVLSGLPVMSAMPSASPSSETTAPLEMVSVGRSLTASTLMVTVAGLASTAPSLSTAA